MAEHPDIAYLKQDHIGRVIASGLAEIYREKPKFPVEYLAHWLLNYSNTKKNEQKVLKEKEVEEGLRQAHQEKVKAAEEEQIKKAQEVEQLNKED